MVNGLNMFNPNKLQQQQNVNFGRQQEQSAGANVGIPNPFQQVSFGQSKGAEGMNSGDQLTQFQGDLSSGKLNVNLMNPTRLQEGSTQSWSA